MEVIEPMIELITSPSGPLIERRLDDLQSVVDSLITIGIDRGSRDPYIEGPLLTIGADIDALSALLKGDAFFISRELLIHDREVQLAI